ncbi:MAG: hypothetical protein R3F60_17390 [bacterium]
MTAALPGLALIALGLLFDGAMTRTSPRWAGGPSCFRAPQRGSRDPLALQVDTTAGAPLLDAVLGADARRRELERYARWAVQEATWAAAAEEAEADAEDGESAGAAPGEAPAEDPGAEVEEPAPPAEEAGPASDAPAEEQPFGAADGGDGRPPADA